MIGDDGHSIVSTNMGCFTLVPLRLWWLRIKVSRWVLNAAYL